MKTSCKILLILFSAACTLTVRADRERDSGAPTRHNEATIAQLQAEMASGKLTSVELTKEYLARIFALDQGAEAVNSIIELNPAALDMAQRSDRLRKQGRVLGPLHGIPVLLKDNIDTGDRMQTSAGPSLSSGNPRSRTPPSLPICAPAVRSSSAKPTFRSGQIFAPSNRSVADRAGAGKPTIPTASIATRAARARAPEQPVFGGLTYNQALAIDHNVGVNGIDKAISQFNLDAVVSATDNPAWSTDYLYGDHFIFGTSGLAAAEGYPIVQVPAGLVFGAPLGISFFGSAFSEPTLIKLASGFEAATQVRAHNLPTFADTVPFNNIQGTRITRPHRRVPPPKASEARKIPHHM